MRSVVIDDDVARVRDSTSPAAAGNRRDGAAGEDHRRRRRARVPDSLDAVDRAGAKVIGQVRSIGVALTAPTVPHAGTPSFDLDDRRNRVRASASTASPAASGCLLEPADALVERMVEAVVRTCRSPPATASCWFTNSSNT